MRFRSRVRSATSLSNLSDKSTKRCFGPGLLNGCPGPFGHVLNKSDFNLRPESRSILMNAEDGLRACLP